MINRLIRKPMSSGMAVALLVFAMPAFAQEPITARPAGLAAAQPVHMMQALGPLACLNKAAGGCGIAPSAGLIIAAPDQSLAFPQAVVPGQTGTQANMVAAQYNSASLPNTGLISSADNARQAYDFMDSEQIITAIYNYIAGSKIDPGVQSEIDRRFDIVKSSYSRLIFMLSFFLSTLLIWRFFRKSVGPMGWRV